MEFKDFQERVTEGLQQIYGENAEVHTNEVLKNNGKKYNVICIILKDSKCRTVPIIEMDRLYEAYKNGVMNMGECIWSIYKYREILRNPDEVERFAEGAFEWEMVKDNVYPILLSTEENQEMLESLVSMPMLDMSVAYIIRGRLLKSRSGGMKINKEMFKYYGMSVEELHRQAMINLEKDGYKFRDLKCVVMEMLHMEVSEYEQAGEQNKPKMYILTNSAMAYGAAGILNRKLIREFAGGRDFIILPSSVHEMLFVPANEKMDQKFFDEMVSVNMEEIDRENRLTDHSYYYDGGADEIRICA